MRHGFTALTQSQKCRANNVSNLAHHVLRNLRVFIQQGRWWPQYYGDSQGVIMIDYLEQGRTINGAYYAGELRRLRQEIARKRRGNWLAVLCTCMTTPLPTRHKLPWLLRLNVDLKSFLIRHILLKWLLPTSICSQNWNFFFMVHSMEAMKAS